MTHTLSVTKHHLLLLICITTLISSGIVQAQKQRMADLGTFTLESGEAIEACQIGYRTFGKLNADKSNAVLSPVWLMGTSASMEFLTGKDKLLDTSRYFVIVADPLGNGISSSPSNSKLQPGSKFPHFTIRDMVRTQHRLVTRVLGLKQLYAVVGISMGGFQALEWAITYPEMVKKAVSIVGTPQPTSSDLMVYEIMLRSIEASQQCSTCDLVGTIAPVFHFVLRTPQHRVNTISREDYPGFLKNIKDDMRNGFQPEDAKSQLRAMLTHDVSAPYSNSLAAAARQVKAEMLFIVASTDHLVRPEPAVEFARLINARVVDIHSDCGHEVEVCQQDKMDKEVSIFLAAPVARQ